ncbi:putative RNA-binding protein 19, partial [Nowakowskiella sp. JEL0078]
TEKVAKAAVSYFNNTFVDTSKIIVQLALKVGDANIPRPWSRYSAGSTSFNTVNPQLVTKTTTIDKPSALWIEQRNAHTVAEAKRKALLLQALYSGTSPVTSDQQAADASKLNEFMSVMQPVSKTKTWANDGNQAEPEPLNSLRVKADVVAVANKKPGGEGLLVSRAHVTFNDEDDDTRLQDVIVANGKADDNDYQILGETADVGLELGDVNMDERNEDSLAFDKNLSDLEYMKLKMRRRLDGDGDEVLESNSLSSIPKSKKNIQFPKIKIEEDVNDLDLTEVNDDNEDMYMEKSELPGVDDGFKPIRPELKAPKEKVSKDSHQSKIIKKSGNILDIGETKTSEDMTQVSRAESKPDDIVIADTGRLYVRNLAYTCTTEELHKLFEKFGPISEVHISADKQTKISRGFGFLLFLFPEHAIKAYTKLNGTIFQGRILDILPGKEKPKAADDIDEITGDDSAGAFKRKNEAEKKKTSQKEVTWNSLFMNVRIC